MTTTEQINISLSDTDRQLVLAGLTDQLLETQRYLSPYQEQYPDPTPLDTCCTGHRARYDMRLDDHRRLLSKKQQIDTLISVLESAELDPPANTTSWSVDCRPINLDAESVRADLAEAPAEHALSTHEAAAICALPDDRVNAALREVVNDNFWVQHDQVRRRAIASLASYTSSADVAVCVAAQEHVTTQRHARSDCPASSTHDREE